jgi:GNAT superfamily N-acetyltransferase
LRIGAPYRWPSESWGQAQWSDYLADPAREYWIVRHTGEVAGLGEFQLQGGGSLEITTFGLVPEYVGQGIGGTAGMPSRSCCSRRGATTVSPHLVAHVEFSTRTH